MSPTYEQIAWDFDYHAPDEEAKIRHQAVRDNCRQLAAFFGGLLPEGREKAWAITKLEEAMFWANAAIARHVEDGE